MTTKNKGKQGFGSGQKIEYPKGRRDDGKSKKKGKGK
jgi:hypothetical protein